MNSSRKARLGLGVLASSLILAQSACTGQAPSSPTPAPAATPAASPSPSPSPRPAWISINERTSCDLGNPADCAGAYGFTVYRDGTFKVGPGPGGQTLVGQIQPNELDRINADALAMASNPLTGNLSCVSAVPGQTGHDTVSLAVPIKPSGVVVYQDQCYLANQQDSFQLHSDMQTLLGEYYPVPFPSPTAHPTPRPTPPVPPIPPTPSPTQELRPIKNGLWGGPGVELRETDQSASFSFDCARGRIDSPILVDSSGSFSQDGTYTLTGGPIPAGEPRSFPATFSGTVEDDTTMSLTVDYTDADGNPVSNDYQLTFGASGELQPLCPIVSPSP